LEATAWLPSGQTPEFRASLDPSEPSLVALLGLLNAGVHAPAREQAHQETQATLAALRQEHAGLQEAHNATCAKQQETIEENDLLLTQLHHVQETLEAHHLENQQQQQQLNELKNVNAEVAKLSKALSEQKQATLNAQQAQSTVEQASVSDKQAFKTLNQQLETLKRDGDKKLASLQEQLTALRASLGAATAESADTQEENDLLLTQLHHVQEELERYFLANREYQATLGSAQRTFLRARQHISRLAARTPQGSVTA